MNNTQHLPVENMLKGQLMTNGISNDSILQALATIDRSAFVPKNLSQAAYVDEDIKLCSDRFLLEPLVFAKLLDAASIEKDHHVLDVGAGLGYGSAVIAQLAKRVTAIEGNAELVASARKKLSAQQVDNVDIVTAPLMSGCNAQKPYDRIIVEGAVHNIPEDLEKQLADGGVIVAIRTLHHAFATQKALGAIIVGHKRGDHMSYVEKEHVCAYPLQKSMQDDVFEL